jgi:hypothetical protein
MPDAQCLFYCATISNDYQAIFSLLRKEKIPLLQSVLARAWAFMEEANVSASSRGMDCTCAIICFVSCMACAELVVISVLAKALTSSSSFSLLTILLISPK